MSVIQGRVWVFGDDLNADQIMPVHFSKAEEEKYACLSAVRPEFSRQVQPGDVIVAGRQCGIGSSRPSPRILKALKVGTVIADSFSGIFFRNAIAIGFPLVELPDARALLNEGDVVEVDYEKGHVTNKTTGESAQFHAYSQLLQDIVAVGGIINTLKTELPKENS